MKNNIVLIGMPTSGKSTVGVIAAKILGLNFIDTDLLIQQKEGKLLCEIIEESGIGGFLKCEEKAVHSVHDCNALIATGGSVVYSEDAMEHLKQNGIVIYLKVSKPELLKRLHDVKERGVVLRPGESVEEMYEERTVLYEKYADFIIEEDGKNLEDTVVEVVRTVREEKIVKIQKG